MYHICRLHFRTSLWILLLLNTLSMYAAESDIQDLSRKPPLHFTHIEGLHNNQVTALTQDNDGYIWIGTNNGLHKYDGYDYRLFLKGGDSSSLSSSRVKCLMVDTKGTLWMGATDGFCRYNQLSDRINVINIKNRYFPDLTNPNVIMDMVEDTVRNLIWVASLNEGLLTYSYDSSSLSPYFDRGEKQVLDHYKLASLNLVSLWIDQRKQRLWVGHNYHGLEYLDLRNNTNHPMPLVNLRGDTIRQILDIQPIDSSRFWIATPHDGIFVVDHSRAKPKVIKNYRHQTGDPMSLFNNNVMSIYQDSKGQLWVSNDNGGLHLYDPTTDGFYCYLPDHSINSITNASIRCVYEDGQGRLWVGTALEGADVVDPLRHKFYQISKSKHQGQSLNNNIIRDFYEAPDGKIWIATDGGGVNIFDPQTGAIEFLTYNDENKNSLSSNAALCFLDAGNKQLWVGTWNGGISIIDTQSKQITRLLPDLVSLQSVFDLLMDQDGYIWATTFNYGLQRIDPKSNTVKDFLYDPDLKYSLKTNLTYTLLEDRNGNIWIGGENAGIYQIRQENKESGFLDPLIFEEDQSLDIANNWTSQIYETRDGRILAATASGLIEIDPETMGFEFILKDKLPISDVRAIWEEDNGDLWLTTGIGLSQYHLSLDSMTHYSTKDGLQKGEFTKNSMLQSKSGIIYLGGSKGVNYFDPKNIPSNATPPNVRLSFLKLFNKNVEIGDSTYLLKQHLSQTKALTFTSDQWRFTIGYVALNYTKPEYNEYAHMLDGLDQKWNYVGSQREVTYTHLPPGKYTFKVKASNNDGVWQELPTELSITILPPWWLTWWALLLWASIFTVVVLVIIHWRTQSLMGREKRLKQMVRQRTEQLSIKNKELEDLNKAITDQAEELKTYNDALNTMNEKLEDLVESRTREIKDKNAKLTKFAFDNAHRVRGPLTRIMGLMGLINQEESETERDFWIKKIDEASQEMDQITRSMGSEIDQGLKKD